MAKRVQYSRLNGVDLINAMVLERQQDCTNENANTVYIPDPNMYRHPIDPTAGKIEASYPFKPLRDCKPIKPHGIEQDINRRYVKHLKTKELCDRVKGTWEPASVNRVHRGTKGVCWRRKEDAHCGTRYQAVNTMHGKHDPTERDNVKNACNSDSLCTWYDPLNDCVRKSLVYDTSEDTKDPPDEMPSDITSSDISTFLYDYFVKRKYGVPPATSALIGQGDRCNAQAGGSTPVVDASSFDFAYYFDNFEDHEGYRTLLKHYKPKIDALFANSPKHTILLKELEQDYYSLKIFYNKHNADELRAESELYKTLKMLDTEYAAHVENQIKIEKYVDPSKKNRPVPSIPQAVVNMVMKNMAKKQSQNRGLMALHSTGSGKTCTATGVMDAFWDTNLQIVFASSLDAVASNPPFKFHECAMNLYPRFRESGIGDADKVVHMRNVQEMFEKREVQFLPFAKLANRIQKTEEFKDRLGLGRAKAGGSYDDIDADVFNKASTTRKRVAKPKQVVIEESSSDEEEKYVPPPKSRQNSKSKKKVVDRVPPPKKNFKSKKANVVVEESSSDEEEYVPPPKRKEKSNSKKKVVERVPTQKKNSKSKKASVVVEESSSDEEEYVPPPKSRQNSKSKKKVVERVPPQKKNSKSKNASVVVEESSSDEEEYVPPPKKVKPPPKRSGKPRKTIVREESSSDDEEEYVPPPKKKNNKPKQIETKERDEEPPVLSTKPGYVAGLNNVKSSSNIGKLVEYLVMLHKVPALRIYNGLKDANISGFEEYIDLDNTCLIIDEVHNLFRPLATQREKHKYVETHLLDPSLHPNLKVTILTATPGDNVPDLIKLINIVRDPRHAPIVVPNVDDPEMLNKFKKSILGLVSFFDMSQDGTLFPVVNDPGPIKLPMSTKQFEKYLEAYKDVKDANKNWTFLEKNFQLNKFWQGARKYSNMLYNFERGTYLTEFSSKLPALLETIAKYPLEKHYAYSSFYEARGSSQGILEIARQLENNGYKKLTVKQATDLNKNGQMPSKEKRFVLALQKEIGEEGTDSAGENLAQLIKIFNHPDNRNGEYIHVFLATQGFNEGIDLKAVRHLHFFEPLLTMASDLQTIGRARRRCSHADLDRSKGEWSVQVHRYMADLPVGALVDEESVQKHLEKLQEQYKYQKERLDKMKSLNDEEFAKEYGFKGAKSMTETEVDRLSLEIKDIIKKIKQSSKKASTDVAAIDEFIRQNALEKAKQLFILTQSIKECAIDCFILEEFHNSTGMEKIRCFRAST